MNKFISLLGIAKKAGKLSLGTDVSIENIKLAKSKLIIFAKDISDKNLNNIKNIAIEYSVDHIQTKETMNDLSQILGRIVGVISVNDSGFAKKLIQLNDHDNKGECVYDDKI